MTPASFSVLVTPRFERDLRKLLKSHADVLALYARVIAILAEDHIPPGGPIWAV